MTAALAPNARFSLIEVVQELISNLKPTSGASTPAYRRAVESESVWDGTRATEVFHYRTQQLALAIDVAAPRFTDSTPAVDELAAISTATDDPDHDMAALALAADSQDEQRFLAASARIDWRQRDAADFLQAIRWALAAGAHRAAGKLAVQGAAQHPDATQLRTALQVLAPQAAIAHRQPADPSVAENHDWLKAHRGQYRGQWVALHHGKLLASADLLEDLTTRFGIDPEILYTRVA